MAKIIYLPLEHIDMRYTVYLDKVITNYLESSKIEFIKIYPNIPKREIKEGSFF